MIQSIALMRARRNPARRRGVRLAFEGLERRDVPAIYAPLAAAADGTGNSLRAAVIQANESRELTHTFQLEAGVYTLSVANGPSGSDDDSLRGDLDLRNPVGQLYQVRTYEFVGQGAGRTIIDGGMIDRVFHAYALERGVVQVILRDLTIRNGLAQTNDVAGSQPGQSPAWGGAILVDRAGLTMENVVVEGNIARGGSGSAFAAAGVNGLPAAGGAIYAKNATVTIRNSTIRDNQALGGNGANGLGGNGGSAQGGAIAVWATSELVLENATISGNLAQGGRGGSGAAGGDGAAGGSGGSGGTTRGGGIDSQVTFGDLAGTPLAFIPRLQIDSSTITANRAVSAPGGRGGLPGGAAGADATAEGGGVYSDEPGGNRPASLSATSTILAGNLADGGTKHDVRGPFRLADHVLLGNNTGSNLAAAAPDANGNLIGSAAAPIDARLGPLAFNGGPTPTHALLPGSPAIDAGQEAESVRFDQRGAGYARVLGARADIGAFESGATGTVTRRLALRLVTVRINRQKRLQARVTDLDTGELVKAITSPFQAPAFRQITARLVDTNGDAAADVVRFDARRSANRRKAVTRSIAI